jgi:hypothetical protein
MGNIVDINVWIAVDNNGKASRVCVADVGTLNNGDTLRWVNKTGGDIIVFFPHDNVLGNATGHFHHKVANNASYHHAGAAARRTPPGEEEQYSYAIYCAAMNRFAVGGSDPEIIIT